MPKLLCYFLLSCFFCLHASRANGTKNSGKWNSDKTLKLLVHILTPSFFASFACTLTYGITQFSLQKNCFLESLPNIHVHVE